MVVQLLESTLLLQGAWGSIPGVRELDPTCCN